MLPLVEWTTGFLPESVSEHLEFEPEEPDDKDSTEPEDKEADNNQATADAGRGTISRDGADAG
jgi:hypothetical protein